MNRLSIWMFACLCPATAWSAVLDVGPTGTWTTVGDAVAAAAAGDRIEVAAGTYPEAIVVDRDLEIVGLGGSVATTLGTSGQTAITVTSGTLTLTGFTLDPASTRGLAVADASVIGDDLVISQITSGLPGAAVQVERGTVEIVGGVFDGNAGADGGSIRAIDSTLTLEGGSFVNGTGATGAVIYTSASTVSLHDCIVDGAHAEARGAIAVDDSDLTVSLSTFTWNTTDDDAAVIDAADSTLFIDDSVFEDNIGDFDGAVSTWAAPSVTIQDSTFARNEATWDGGGIHIMGTELVLIGSTFVDNVSHQRGGGASVSVDQSLFVGNHWEGNSAESSGGAMEVSDWVSAEIVGDTYASNESAWAGGALTLRGTGDSVVRDCSFSDNRAVSGGAMSINFNENVEVVGSAFCANTADVAAAVWLGSPAGLESTLFANNLFADNTSFGAAGAIQLTWWAPHDIPAVLVNNTFAGNTATTWSGAHIDTVNLPVDLRNNIFAFADPVAVTTNLTNFQSDYDLWFGSVIQDISGAVTATELGPNEVFADPAFHAYSADGDCTNDLFALRPTSPAIDAGDPAILDPDGTVSDIGAFGGELAWVAEGDDLDGDGYFDGLSDCDDGDPAVHVDADELCNGLDDNCNDLIDEEAVDATPWYADTDGDGFGDPLDATPACEPLTGRSSVAGDCDDADETVHPDATELCDGVDNDCDDELDEGVLQTWYEDQDGDGFGGEEQRTCEPLEWYVARAGDCDDLDPKVHRGAKDERGDGVDQDCDGRDGSGCGCTTGAPGAGSSAILFLAALGLRRRSRNERPRIRPSTPRTSDALGEA